MRRMMFGLIALSMGLALAACESTSSAGNSSGANQDAAATNDNSGSANGDGTGAGGNNCETADDCAGEAGDECTQAICDAASGMCIVGNVPDGTPCDDGDVCSVSNQCKAGACDDGAPAPPNCGG